MAARPATRPVAVETAASIPPVALTAVCKAVGDELRASVLRVLRDDSFGVLELCSILNAAQPALSHHLKILYQAGLVLRRREGNSIYYRRAPAATALHAALLEAIDEAPLDPAVAGRIDNVHGDRRRTSLAFFSQHAEAFAANQARICEASVYAGSVLDAVARARLGDGTALEIGPGNGELLTAMAGRFRRVVGIDSSPEMLERCATRTRVHDNLKLLHRDLADLPARPRYQLVVAAMVLHHQPSPQRFFRRVKPLLVRGGVLAVVELCHHDQEWARSACGDLWLGFEPDELAQWADNAGFQAGDSEYLAQKNGFRVQIHTYHNTPPV